jgi:hypothetical protein
MILIVVVELKGREVCGKKGECRNERGKDGGRGGKSKIAEKGRVGHDLGGFILICSLPLSCPLPSFFHSLSPFRQTNCSPLRPHIYSTIPSAPCIRIQARVLTHPLSCMRHQRLGVTHHNACKASEPSYDYNPPQDNGSAIP